MRTFTSENVEERKFQFEWYDEFVQFSIFYLFLVYIVCNFSLDGMSEFALDILCS